MITTLIDLKNHIINDIGYPCDIGDRDLSPDEYPFIKIIPDVEFALQRFTQYGITITFPVTLKIIVARDNEIQGLEVLISLLKSANTFQYEKDNVLLEGGTPEYTDTTYEISVPFQLKENLLKT